MCHQQMYILSHMQHDPKYFLEKSQNNINPAEYFYVVVNLEITPIQMTLFG